MRIPSHILTILFLRLLWIASVSADEAAVAEDGELLDLDTTTEELPVEKVEEPPEPASSEAATEEVSEDVDQEAAVQSGPFVDLFGPNLLSLEMIDDTHAQLQPHLTNDVLEGKKVIGLYFSADWCGPCRQFTPELNAFYEKINSRRGWKDKFEIVWISRCRDTNSYGQYFTQMGGWLALPPEEAMGQRGQWLGEKFKTKGIPHLVLLDDAGGVITLDARNKIPQDKAGIGFPWRNPISTLYMTLVPRSLRLMVKSQLIDVKDHVLGRISRILRPNKATV